MYHLKLKIQQDHIIGFSYLFSRTLLDELNRLFTTDTLFVTYDNGAPKEITDIAKNICHYLQGQMPYYKWQNIKRSIDKIPVNEESEWKGKFEEAKEEIKAIIAKGYDFLKIFEVDTPKTKQQVPIELAEKLNTPLENLELSVRAFNKIKAAKIYTLTELVRYTEEELMKFKNFGNKSLTEINEVLHQMGLSFGMEV